jgi:hypothetical protein
VAGGTDKTWGRSDHPNAIVGLDEFRKNVLRLHFAKSGVLGHALDEIRVRRGVYAHNPDVPHRDQTIERSVAFRQVGPGRETKVGAADRRWRS